MDGVIGKTLPPQRVETMLYNKMLLEEAQVKILGPAKKAKTINQCHQIILTDLNVGHQVRPDSRFGGIYRGFVKNKVTSELKISHLGSVGLFGNPFCVDALCTNNSCLISASSL